MTSRTFLYKAFYLTNICFIDLITNPEKKQLFIGWEQEWCRNFAMVAKHAQFRQKNPGKMEFIA